MFSAPFFRMPAAMSRVLFRPGGLLRRRPVSESFPKSRR
jgi:hypothetical protein